METRWLVIAHGKSHGPFTPAQLRALAVARKISPGTQLRRESDGSRIIAASLRGLFSTDLPPPPPEQKAATEGSPTRPSSPRPPVAPPAPPVIESADHGSDRAAVGVEPGVLRVVLYVTLGLGALSILMEPWAGHDADDRLAYPIAFVGFWLFALAAVVLETALLFCCWHALPRPYRFQNIGPWLGAGLTFVPLFGLGWYFVAYGLLGEGWRREAAERTPDHDATLSWAGWACAGGLLVMWLLQYASFTAEIVASQNGGNNFMAWYEWPLFEGDPVREHRPGGRHRAWAAAIKLLLQFFSLHAVACAAMLYLLYRFYAAIIERVASNRASSS